MLHRSFIIRELTRSKKQGVVFVLCVVLSLVTLIALDGFSRSVNESMLKDARTLHGGDIIIHSHYNFSTPLEEAVASLRERGLVRSAKVYDFYSVVRTLQENDSLLTDLKIVEPAYPFYGTVELKSKRPFEEVLTRGKIIVEQGVLDRLHVRVGDTLHVGDAPLTIQDVVLHEPDRPVSFFSLGPRIFISSEDLEALDLVQKGSRIDHLYLLKVLDPQNVDRLADELRIVAVSGQERVDTYRTAESRVKRFFDNFLFFLSLIGVFTLLLAGIGIQSALTAFLQEKEKTVAIMKTVGATNRFITLQFTIVLCLLGLMGTLIGICAGLLLQDYLPAVFKGLLPENIQAFLSWRAVFEGLSLGVFVVAMFASLPLYRLRDLKPSAIFRKEETGSRKGYPYYLTVFTILLVFVAMIFWQLKEVKIGLYFILSVSSLILITSFLTRAILFFLQKKQVKSLALRQALKGLFRPRNATQSIIITLTASLSVIFSITLLEQNLDANFIRSYPQDAPNVFFLDIQPSQLKDFSSSLGMDAEYYPIVRARIVSINGIPIDTRKEMQRRGDNLAREFNLTYRDYLLKDEAVIKGGSLFQEDGKGVQVSVLDSVAEANHMRIGDRIDFNIQGVPLTATIVSIRTRTKEFIQPFFYFVFQEKVLRDAPQTVFTAVRIPADQISSIQNRIVTAFPNVSVIDLTKSIDIFAKVLHKLSGITQFFTFFSIIAGILIIISSVLATRFARIQEAVYFKILGARRSFILKVFTLENALLGFVSALLALILSQTGSWIISIKIFDIQYHSFPLWSIFMVMGTLVMVISVGLVSSISILTQKPVTFLREQTEE